MHNLDLLISVAEEMEAERSLASKQVQPPMHCSMTPQAPSLKGAVSNVAMVVLTKPTMLPMLSQVKVAEAVVVAGVVEATP